MRLCSFGRSFLGLSFSGSASPRRVLRAFMAARRRWPGGRLEFRDGCLRWVLGGSCGVMLELWSRPAWLPRWYSWADFRREGKVLGGWCDSSFVTGYLPLWWAVLRGRL